MRRTALILLLVALTTAAGLIAPRPADACSCAPIDPTTALAEYPAAFVGTLVDVERSASALIRSDADAVYRFEVETWVKGDLGDVVDVHAPSSGASCGIEVGMGNRAGLFLNIDNGEATSHLCATVDADVLLAALEPIDVGADGPAYLFMSGRFGEFGYITVNSDGAVVNALPAPSADPYDQPWSFSSCPDSELIVEMWSWQLIVRDLSDLSIVHQISLEGFADTISVGAVRCAAADGSSILLAGEEWDGKASHNRIYEAVGGLRPIADLPVGQMAIGPHFVVSQGYRGDTVTVFDWTTERSQIVHEVNSSEPDYTGIASVTISPDGTKVAVLEVRYSETGGPGSTLILYEPSGAELASTEIDGEAWSTFWLGHERLMVQFSDDEGNTSAHVFDASLEPMMTLRSWNAYHPVIQGDTLYGIDGGTLVRGDLTTGHSEELSTFPVQYLGPIALLPADFEISTEPNTIDSANPTTRSVAGVTPNDTVPPATIGDQNEQAVVTGIARTVLLILSVTLVLAIAIVTATRNRKKSAGHAHI